LHERSRHLVHNIVTVQRIVKQIERKMEREMVNASFKAY
jgi:hypothetical protein